MATKWQQEASGEGTRAEKIPEGYHRVKVKKVVRRYGSGDEMRTDNGGPFMMVVFECDSAEATENYFVTDKTAWKLAQALERMGVDLAKMEQNGVDVSHFEDEQWANKVLIGRECWVRVEHVENGKYTNVEVLHEEELPRHAKPVAGSASPPPAAQAAAGGAASSQASTGPAVDMNDDDIPF